jgi:hypothetical protein
MLLIVGGPARTGKGIIARRLLIETHLPYLSLDIVKMGLANGVPAFGMDPDESSIIVAEKLWPLVRAMAINMIETGMDYIIEGEILPHHVHELIQHHQADLKACFLGYREIAPAQKLREIREFGGHPNDWISTFSDAYILELINQMITFSHYLHAECARLGLPYFDTSRNFRQTLDHVVDYLRPC